MGGLVKDMSEFFDAANGIRATAEVAPHWRMVSERSGQPIDERIMLDITDPHWSTWPACIAVKAAGLQGADVGERYLRRLRRAALTERIQVQREDAQLALAREVRGLDLAAFQTELGGPRAAEAFREDIATCRAYGVSGFPTLLLQPADDDSDRRVRSILVNGYRSLQSLERALAGVAPGLVKHPARSVGDLLAEYGPLTEAELSAISSLTPPELANALDAAAARGRVARKDVRAGTLWEPISGAATAA
jgi:predicted DsbA family dithiol-disulfide isomerase